jgi:hypothetical protein
MKRGAHAGLWSQQDETYGEERRECNKAKPVS